MLATHWPSARWKMLPSLRPRRLRAMVSLLLCDPVLYRFGFGVQLPGDLLDGLALGVQLPGPVLALPVEVRPAGRGTGHAVGAVDAGQEDEVPAAHRTRPVLPAAGEGQ